MRLVWNRWAQVADWVAQRIPQMEGGDDFGLCVAVGIVAEDGRPLGGVVFNNWLPRYGSIEISFAADSPRWLTKRLITEILRYPFDQLKVARLTSITPKKNKAARAFIDAFGFKREGVVRCGFGNDDAIISGLLKREWAQSRFNLDRQVQRKTDLTPALVS